MNAIVTPKDLVNFVVREGRPLNLFVCGIQSDAVEIGNNRGKALFVWPTGWKGVPCLAENFQTGVESYCKVYLLGFEDDLGELPSPDAGGVLGCLRLPLAPCEVLFDLGGLVSTQVKENEDDQVLPGRDRSRFELTEILSIYRTIQGERDIDRLLAVILSKCRYVTGADAGSLYLVEEPPLLGEYPRLRFKITQNDSVPVDFNEFTLDISGDSIVGQAVLSVSSINIDDLYDEETMAQNGWKHDRSFDRRIGYQSHSMLTVPLLNKNAEVIGVVQLINRKRNPRTRLWTPKDFKEQVVPFDRHSEEVCRALAALTGIALENTLLYGEVQALFEGFVRASMTAVESRDPSTLGHSKRVSELTRRLAEEVNRSSAPPFQDIRFNSTQMKELEYASLLHDFGKIGVQERILRKPEKLYPEEKAIIRQRFETARQALAVEALTLEVELTRAHGGEVPPAIRQELEAEYRDRQGRIEEFAQLVEEACRPTLLDHAVSERLGRFAGWTYQTLQGEPERILTDEEYAMLRIPRGTLTLAERQEMERHVLHTANFLKLIPWGFDYAGVPLIAAMHHEKVDGTGYPHRFSATQIPLQARILAVCDMFDALTSADRPYKKAVAIDRALEILRAEAERGALDPTLVELFITSGWHQ